MNESAATECDGAATEDALGPWLNAVMDSSDDAIIGKTLDGRIVRWNKGAERAYGYTAEEAIGRSMNIIIPPGLAAEYTDFLHRLAAGETVRHETTRQRKDGGFVQASVRITPVYDANGQIIGAASIARDITSLRQTQESLRLASRYNRSLIEASLDPLVTIGPSGTITDVNAATESITGHSRTRLIGSDFADYFTDPEKAREGYRTVFREQTVVDYALEIRHRDGHTTPVLYNASVYRNESGAVAGVFAAARNVTALRAAEIQLKRVNRALQAVTLTGHVLLRARDEMDLLQEVCRIIVGCAGYRMCWVGYACHDAEKNVRVVMAAGEGAEYASQVRVTWDDSPTGCGGVGTAIKTASAWMIEDIERDVRFLPWRERALQHGFKSAIGVPLMDEGRVFGALSIYGSEPNAFVPEEVGLLQDLANNLAYGIMSLRARNERDRAEAVLRESEERMRAVFEQAAVGVTIVLPNGVLQQVNDRYCKILGRDADDLIGHDYRAFTHEDDIPIEEEHVAALVKGSASMFTLEKRYVRPDATSVWASVSVSVVRDERSSPRYYLAFVEDIDERRRAREALNRLNEELEEHVAQRTRELETSNKELESFAYSVSHDLRAPLRSIDGFSRILLKECGGLVDDNHRRWLEMVSQNATQMGKLIDDLLRFSRLGRAALERSKVDMDGLVRTCLHDLEAEREGRTLDLVIGPLGTCQGDQNLLRQVWVNLLGNAFKFTRRRDPARIEVGRTNAPEPTFYVRDNGVGFDMKYARKLFGVFQRLHRAEDFEGTGIGLALVSRIVTRHGGRVWAEGDPGEGATFFFTLADHSQSPSTDQEPSLTRRGQT